MKIFDGRQKPVGLGHSIGQGGEAKVYRVDGQPHMVAKIYEPAAPPHYEAKLAWMISHPPENPKQFGSHQALAWPEGLLYGADRRFAGYLMPYFREGRSILNVYNPRRRTAMMPRFDRRALFRAAYNLATCVASVHRAGYVIGDLNESNVLVNPYALVSLIDTDSFQVHERTRRKQSLYVCPVGKAEYTPPELQGKPLREMTRLPEHDAFSLAVLIFQLLMEGSHPFRAQWLESGEPPPLEKRILNGLYPYGTRRPKTIEPPHGGPALAHLHPDLVRLFEACFVEGHQAPSLRPRADDWRAALREAEKALHPCVKGHYYSTHLETCPVCRTNGNSPGRAGTTAPAGGGVPAAREAPVNRGAPPAGRRGRPPTQPTRSPSPVQNRQAAAPAPAGRPGAGSGASLQAGVPIGSPGVQTAGPQAAARVSPAGGNQTPTSGRTGRGFFPTSGPAPAPPAQPTTRPAGPRPSPFPSHTGKGSGPQPMVGKPFFNRWPPWMGPFPQTAGSAAGGAAQSRTSGTFSWPTWGRRSARPGPIWQQPGWLKTWVRPRVVKSVLYGSSQGALVGVLPGALMGLLVWLISGPTSGAGWAILWATGGFAAGGWRAWQPTHTLGLWIHKNLGWDRFWRGAGMAMGALIGTTLGGLLWWLVFPLALGFFGGAYLGRNAGRNIYLAGIRYGWERILAISGTLAAAFLGSALGLLGASSLLGAAAFQWNAGLLLWLEAAQASHALSGLASGALAGILGGAIAGTFSDLAARLLGLLD